MPRTRGGMPPLSRAEEVARDFGRLLCNVYRMLSVEQQAALLDLSHNAEDRVLLSVELARTLYRTGFGGLDVETLHALCSEGELQAMLFLLVIGETHERVTTYAARLLCRKPDFLAYVRARYQTEGDEYPGTPRVPTLWERERAGPGDTHPPRTRRSRTRA